MADRPPNFENMAVSSDAGASQHNMKDNDKEENDNRGTQSHPKVDAPKKKTTFKITSVTKSSQRGGSGDLTQDNDLDSQDDLDETVDSHTEDLSSEIYDNSSKATDMDNQDQLTPEDVVKESEPKEKPARFKVVKVETKEPFKRGRWMCYDFLDQQQSEKTEAKQEEINVNSGNSGSSSTTNSVHYVHGVDDPSKNPLLAGATGTLPSQQQQQQQQIGDQSGKLQGEASQQQQQQQQQQHAQQQASSSQQGMTPMTQSNSTYPNHAAMSSGQAPYTGAPGSVSGQSMKPVVSVNNTSGNVQYPNSGQSQAMPASQGSSIPANVHSQQSASVPGSGVTGSQLQAGLNSMGQEYPQRGQDYVNSMGQGQVGGVVRGQHEMAPQSAYGMNNNPAGMQNHPPSSSMQGQVPDGYHSEMDLSHGSHSSSVGLVRAEGEDSSTALGPGPGLAPLEIAVGGITSTGQDDEITEDTGSSTVAIDNKIEQAMDLVKSHLMYAVREEVEVLKEQIKELMERLAKLEHENKVLRSEASPDTLSKLPAPLPPIQNPLLQQLMALHNPSSSTPSTS